MTKDFNYRRIIVKYSHSNIGNEINFCLSDCMYNSEHHCAIELNTLVRQNKYITNYKRIDIEYIEFERFFELFLNLNFKDICLNNKFMRNKGLPDTMLEIGLHNDSFSLCSYIFDYKEDTQKRGLGEMITIFKNLLEIFNIDEDLTSEHMKGLQ